MFSLDSDKNFVYSSRFNKFGKVPQGGEIDRQLVLGSAVFGIGWGISGLCPGPAFASVLLEPGVIIPYLVALVLGSLAYERFHR